MTMTPDQVRQRAEARYGSDGYDTADQIVFVLLVDAAEQVERDLRAATGAAPADARLITFKALADALAAREGDRGERDPLVAGLSIVSGLGAGDAAAVAVPPRMPDSFADLVDIAWAYEQDIAAERGDRLDTGDPDAPLSLAEAANLTPRAAMLLGLAENLDMRDDEQHDTPA